MENSGIKCINLIYLTYLCILMQVYLFQFFRERSKKARKIRALNFKKTKNEKIYLSKPKIEKIN